MNMVFVVVGLKYFYLWVVLLNFFKFDIEVLKNSLIKDFSTVFSRKYYVVFTTIYAVTLFLVFHYSIVAQGAVDSGGAASTCSRT